MWPLDMETILASVKKTGRAVVVQEAPRTGGFAGEIASRIHEEAILQLDAPVLRVTSFDLPFPPFSLEEWYLPHANRVIKTVKKSLQY
jgi:pyruvate dehydrogenase E1 component beta subunit